MTFSLSRRPRRRRSLLAFCAACLAAAVALLLHGCGGGLVAGVGSGGSGIAEGTVSGFGSVIVDGVEYDDSTLAPATRSALRLGQRVRLTFDANNAAQTLQVLAQLRGPVTTSPDADGWLKVTDQWVRIVQSAADRSRSGATVLDGYAAVAAIASGQDLAAYGSWVYDGSKDAYVLVATRLERLAVAADPVQTGGVVVAVTGAGLRLNAATGTAVVADRLPALSEGRVVTVSVARSTLSAVPLRAIEVQDASLGALDLRPFGDVRLGGLASRYDAESRTVVVQGTRLPIAASLAVDAARLYRGEFVRIDAMPGGDGMLVAGGAVLRDSVPGQGPGGEGDAGGATELKGLLAGVDWNAAAVRFTLRDVAVVADTAAIADACRAAAADAALYVEVQGFAPFPGAAVVATRVNCSSGARSA